MPEIISRNQQFVPRREPNNALGGLPKKRHPVRAVFLVLLGLIALLIVYFGWRVSGLSAKIFVGKQTSLYGQVTDLVKGQTGSIKLIGETDGQVNVLLIGVGGAGHDGGYLTDTMLLAQIRPEDKKVTLSAIPRDYLINSTEIGQRKLNALFPEIYSRTKSFDKAGAALREQIGKMAGVNIPYFAMVDFRGFEKVVDAVGGVEVKIDRTFTDYTYPDENEGYLPAVTFKAGSEVMSGKRALIFARSRHAAGPEGSDFARSVRQQKIITAVKTKGESLDVLANPKKLSDIANILGDHVHTNLSPAEVMRLYSLGKEVPQDNVLSQNLDPETGIICPKILEDSGAYVLVLCDGKTSKDLTTWFQSINSSNKLSLEAGVVWVADSSRGKTLYSPVAAKLQAAGLKVIRVAYTGKPLSQNVMYLPNTKTKPETTAYLAKELQASEVNTPPTGVKLAEGVDILLILGANELTNPNNPGLSPLKP